MSLADAGILARAIDAVRVNDVRRVAHITGRPVWLKRRRLPADAVILAGNVFLAASNSRIHMFPSCERWRRHELSSFRLLHGPEFACGVAGRRALWFDEMPGRSLRQLSDRNELTIEALRAAGREFARVHALVCSTTGQPWSHGDPHLANVLFDASTARARLIDFETAHEPGLPVAERQADDLLTFLLELSARSTDQTWEGNAEAFVAGYAPAAATRNALLRRLKLPAGLERVLWQTRTEYMPSHRLVSRLRVLRDRV